MADPRIEGIREHTDGGGVGGVGTAHGEHDVVACNGGGGGGVSITRSLPAQVVVSNRILASRPRLDGEDRATGGGGAQRMLNGYET